MSFGVAFAMAERVGFEPYEPKKFQQRWQNLTPAESTRRNHQKCQKLVFPLLVANLLLGTCLDCLGRLRKVTRQAFNIPLRIRREARRVQVAQDIMVCDASRTAVEAIQFFVRVARAYLLAVLQVLGALAFLRSLLQRTP